MKLQKNWLEWTVFGVSALIVAAVLGLLVTQAVATGEEPPEVVVITAEPQRTGAGFLVPVEAVNRGAETVENAEIEVTLELGGRVVERGTFMVAFLPRHSKRNGWVQFERDPRCCRISARAVGFEKP
jgi:uncharacterized protein (TIGR02588 family)